MEPSGDQCSQHRLCNISCLHAVGTTVYGTGTRTILRLGRKQSRLHLLLLQICSLLAPCYLVPSVHLLQW